MNTYASGDDITINFTLVKNSVALAEGLAGASVICAIIKTDRSALATGTTEVSATITDETACKCTATWPKEITGTIAQGKYLVEAKVVKSGSETTFIGALIEVVKGLIQ